MKVSSHFMLFKGQTTRSVSKSYYDMLEVKKSASSKEIKSAYYKRCKEIHPDNNKNDTKSHDKFVHLNHAYHILIDKNKRQDYDSSLNSPNRPQYEYKNRPGMAYSSGFAEYYDPYFYEMYRRAHSTSYSPNVLIFDGSPLLFMLLVLIFGGSVNFVAYKTLSQRLPINDLHLTSEELEEIQKRVKTDGEFEIDRLIEEIKKQYEK